MSSYIGPTLPGTFLEANLRQFDRELLSGLDRWALVIKAILDRGISFEDNVDCSLVSVTSHATPGTEFSVAHLLGKVPTGRLIYGQNGAGSLYDGTTSNNATTMYFRSDAATRLFRLIVF